MVKLREFIPTIALVCIDINIFIYTYWLVTNFSFNLFVFARIVKLRDFIPTVALLGTDINIFACTICMLLMFTLTYLYLLELLN